ncbi:MAG: LexA family transcriptional regulator [Nitrospinae bacterium]|nr:LexA family transcriptional regulator [Nitrospinota bacterium]
MPAKKIWNRIGLLQEGLALTAFCRQVGLSYQAMKKCSQRQIAPDTKSLVKIARHFRTDFDWLVTGEKKSNKLNVIMGKKIKQFRKMRGWSLNDLAEKVSINLKILDLYEKGQAQISFDLLADLAKKLEVSPHEFLVEEDAYPVQVPELKVFQANSAKNAPKLREEDYVSIPLTESSIAAGQPIIQADKIEDYVLLHIRAAGKRNNLVASRVDGDSMEPMLHSGDIVVIDRDDKRIVKNRIYAIFHEEGLTAKYVERKKELLILRPINPNSDVQIIDLKELPDPIVGRIIGAWKEL